MNLALKKKVKPLTKKGNIKIVKKSVTIRQEYYERSLYHNQYVIDKLNITEPRFYVYKNNKLVKEYKSKGAATKLMNKLYKETKK